MYRLKTRLKMAQPVPISSAKARKLRAGWLKAE
jgi:hypothetical protein